MVLFACLVVSCGNSANTPDLPDISEPVDVEGASERVSDASGMSIKARERLSLAEAELNKAKKETEAAKALVAQMKKKNSPYAESVETLRREYEDLVDSLTQQLKQTGIILDEQLLKLKQAGIELNEARKASAASEAEKQVLRQYGKNVAEKLNKAEKRANDLQSWKDANMWYKKFFWWTVIGATVFVVGYVYLTGLTGGIGRFLRR